MATATLSKKEWPFAPQAVNNCLLWLDAADESSYTPGASVSTWRNKGYSGGSATATGTVGSTTADINGLSAMAFATNAYMTAPSMTFTQTTRTVFVVVNIGAPDSVRQFMTSANTIDMQFYSYISDLEMNYSGHFNYVTETPYPMFNTTSILCGTTLSTNGGIFINGLAQTPYSVNDPAAYSTGTTTTQLLGNSSNASFVLGEAMLFDGAITDIQRQQVEGYLAAKWGLQSLLPVTHPYYTLYNLITYAFEPTQIPTCALWLDASDATSITGTSVSRWLDKSGNGNNGIPISSGPTLVKNVQNGLPGLTFPTTANIMLCGNLLAGTNYSVLAVVKYTVSGDQHALGQWKIQYGSGLFFSKSDSIVATVSATTTYTPFGPRTAADTSAFHIYAASLTSSTVSSSATLIAGTDGNDATYTNSGGPNTATALPFSVGGYYEGSTGYYPLTGYICEVIVYNTTLTANQLKQVESYLGTKWNIPVAGQGSVAPVANPLSISGCQLWLDAADATTIVPVVSTWRDKSGNGYNLIAGTGVTTYTNFGPGPSVKLDTSYLYVNKAVDLTQYTVFSVLLSQTAIGNQPTVTGRPNTSASYSSTDGFGLYVDANSPRLRFYGTNSSYPTINNTTATTISQPLVLSSYTCNSAGVVYSWINGIPGSSTTSGGSTRSSTGQGFSIGGEWNGSVYISQSGTGSVCNVYEVIVYNSVLTTTQRLQVENYLMAKWGCGRNFWIDASDATTVTKGTTVTQWLDKSGNGNNATTLNSTVTYSAAGLAFNGSAYMSVPGIAGTLVNTPFVIFIVETLGATGTCLYFGDDNVNNGGAFGYSLHTGYRNSNNQTFAMYGSDLEDTTVSGTGNKRIWALYLPTASNRNTRRNGTVDATFSNFNRLLAFTAPVIGRCFGGAYYVGTISEIIVYNQDIGLTAIQQIETYLGNKWGIAVTTSVPGVTNPASIAGCKLWLDSADPAALVTAVSQMNDKSGNGYNITQATATYQPTLTNNYLALGTSLNYYMNMPQAAINNTSSWTLFLVFNPSSSTNWIIAKQFDGVNSYNMLSMTNYTNTFGNNTTGTTGVLYFRPFNAGTLFIGPAALTTSTNQLLTLICNGTNIYYYLNGVLAAITDGTFTIQNQTGATNATLGAWIADGTITNSGVTNFQLGELSFYNSALTTIQTQEIAASLMNKWSITNTLETATGSLIDTPFLPTDIAGCYFWLDGADTSSMTMTGTTISQWNDKSGNGYNATVASGKTAATYSIDSNCVYFPASDTGYVTSCPADPATETMFVVFNNPTPSSGNNIIIGGQVGARSFGAGYSADGVGYSGILNNEIEWLARQGYYTSGTTAIYTGISENSGESTQLSQNGGPFSSYGTANVYSSGTTTYLGVDTSTPAYYYIGFVMEIIFYDSVLSTAQIAQVNKYLKNKWNIGQTDITIPIPVYNRTFQPVDISGCQLWLDAADTSSNSITFSSGTTVSEWLDKSGNGNNGTANTGVTWAANGMGTNLPAMTFTNTQWFLGNISITGPTMTVFGVISMSASSPFAARMIALAAPNENDYNNPSYVGILRQSSNNMGPYRNGNYPSVTFSYNTPTLLSTWYDGTNANISANGALTPSSSGSLGDFTISSYAVAANTNLGDIGAASFYGYMSELIVYNSSLSTSQRQQVEAYLAWKWNLRSSLPSAHPGYTLPSFSTVFTPKSISSLTLWLDGADPAGTGVAPINGSSITTWVDKSGLGNSASGGVSPTFVTNSLNGLGILTFDGTSQYLYAPTFTVPTATHFMIAVHKPNSIGSAGESNCDTGILRAQSSGSSGGYIVFPYSSYGYFSSFNGSVILNNYDTAGEWNVYGVNVASDNTVQYQNGSSSSSTSAGVTATTSDAFTIGAFSAYGASPVQYYSGSMAEIIVCSNTVTTFQRQQIEGYLAWKWGVQSLLPSTHAFKKFKP